MRDIKDRLQRKALLRAFLNKSIFNGGEVNYLSVLFGDSFHVFRNTDVIKVLGDELVVENNSTEQKVVFRHGGIIFGELEMRCESEKHYQQVRFNMLIAKIMPILIGKITPDVVSEISENIIVYGKARNTLGNWPRITKKPRPKADLEKKLLRIKQKYP